MASVAICRVIVLSVALLNLLAGPAFAYDDCGNPPESPSLPGDPAHAGEDDAKAVQESVRDYRLDIEGYLTCQQLAEFDVAAEAQRGERTAASAEVLRQRFQEQAADARGRQSHWLDESGRWLEDWSHAHNRPIPAPPQD